MNTQLDELHTDRSTEGIKKHRRIVSYKAIVTELNNESVSDFLTPMELTANAAETLNDNIQPPPLLQHRDIYKYIKVLSACSFMYINI